MRDGFDTLHRRNQRRRRLKSWGKGKDALFQQRRLRLDWVLKILILPPNPPKRILGNFPTQTFSNKLKLKGKWKTAVCLDATKSNKVSSSSIAIMREHVHCKGLTII